MFDIPAHELTRNPVDGTWGFICREHGIYRGGLAEAHALNVERKHLREDHAEPVAGLSLDLTAMARWVKDWADRPSSTRADNTTRAVAIRGWLQLTGLPELEALELADRLAAQEAPVSAAVAPF